MAKHLISMSDRQDSVYEAMSKDLGLSFSEVVRRALDSYIDEQVKNGSLMRYTFKASDKECTMETPKKNFLRLLEYVESNPNGAVQMVRD